MSKVAITRTEERLRQTPAEGRPSGFLQFPQSACFSGIVSAVRIISYLGFLSFY
jgi:hypothetical protein